MVDHLDQIEREDRELNVVKRARFNQTIEIYQSNEVPEPKFGVEPHTVQQLPALPVKPRCTQSIGRHLIGFVRVKPGCTQSIGRHLTEVRGIGLIWIR